MTDTPIQPPGASAARRSLVEVLEFLDRRGASPDAIRMAMVRAGIQPDVSHLLSQCLVPLPLETAEPSARSVAAAPVSAAEPHPQTADRALRWFANTFIVWGLLLSGGFALGFTVGAELGVAYGIEQGFDQVQQAVQTLVEGGRP